MHRGKFGDFAVGEGKWAEACRNCKHQFICASLSPTGHGFCLNPKCERSIKGSGKSSVALLAAAMGGDTAEKQRS